ncbi:aminotransferase class III-fold pyridoxal phosphate-dependent enzyme [Sphingomonas nostoxanthinifaciens]|uniref:aminotransferase class III-fold pyridoxal phosphate-dependent enzyme n=1 Tax=Sphingomonas nostoxanthinifaciens TaxID=2872652 RepID=UPI001CC1C821|nr:aminotransferase class III-fold pyridoxal phosphate-dependent enzyme [Sphingomonas nostoxanthinifaciens]UAK25078.1 aminotransferase class III-fold pyridoxal phosphate-dependent enzyme [Sphingomonas nostoxanthinifaciens]
MSPIFAFLAAGAIGLGAPAARRRLILSRSKHGSLTGHVRWAKRIAGQIPAIDYDADHFFRADGAPDAIARQREAAFERLSATFAARYPKSRALTAETRPGLSDLQFTGSYRVPFQFSRLVRERLGVGAFMERSDGVTLTDLDGNIFYDLTGSYGVNVLGTDAYKELIAQAVDDAGALGPVLGSLHPLVADTVPRLLALSGMDEVSFHMSGTEAVMQAVRLARYHTGRTHLVRFAGAYHGWWGDVQPGIGNPIPADNTYTLADMSERTLRTLRSRRNIACVLVNPLQALHPNGGAPADSSLVDGGRRAGVDRAAYAAWLAQLAAVCAERGIVLILDDVFTGFRLAKGGAAEYFGIRPDLVTYGKTLGGGLPVGVLCGKAALMKRFRPDRPADICFARGTFNAHPYIIAAMNALLRRIEEPATAALYDGLDERWNGRAALLNAALGEAGLPVRVANLSSIWTVLYDAPSRYNWMLQYYLRAEGLALSWVGSGRIIFSLNYSDADFAAVVERFVAAATAMQADGWFWHADGITNKLVRRTILREMLAKRLGRA